MTHLNAQEVLDQIENLARTLRVQIDEQDSAAQAAAAVAAEEAKKQNSGMVSPTTFNYPCLFIDGSCNVDTKRGGWGLVFYLAEGQVVIERGKGYDKTTNNRMELQAAIEACKLIKQCEPALATLGKRIYIYCDSTYVIKGITQWVHGWKRKNWMTASKGEVLNQDLWKELDALNQSLPITDWIWVKAHNGVEGNERADFIAQSFTRGLPVDLINELDTPKN